jgi:two-component system, OmpR family, KDP operon response regulator KdpE
LSEGRILIVDDDAQLRRVLRVSMTAQGYEVGDVRSGEEAISNARSERYELVLLDINLPGMNGIDVCRALRGRPHSSELAIIMLSVRKTEADRIEALNAGADDYVTKPFSMAELLARIRATLRRMPADPAGGPFPIKLQDVKIDFSSRRVIGPDRNLRLTPKEFEVLSYLVAFSGRTVGHRELLRQVWGANYGNELEYLRVFVNRLRSKIEPDPTQPRFLLTDAGVGYRFCPPE